MTSAVAARRDRQVVRLLTLLKVLKEGGRPSIYFKVLFVLIVLDHDRRKVVHAWPRLGAPGRKVFGNDRTDPTLIRLDVCAIGSFISKDQSATFRGR